MTYVQLFIYYYFRGILREMYDMWEIGLFCNIILVSHLDSAVLVIKASII